MNNRLPHLLGSVRFYLTRLRRSSPAELASRLKQAAMRYRTGRLARRGRLPCHVPSVAPQTVRTLAMPAFRGEVERIDVYRILAGFRFTLNSDPDDISRCEQGLRQRYCPPTRSSDGQADIRAVWEPARLQHVTLLIACLRQWPDAPEGAAIRSFARREILSWLSDNRFPLGPHYLSAMECGLRLPVFFYALKTLDNLSSGDAEAILTGIFLHAWWIERNLSLFSSLGNHTVCEALGLVVAGSIYRDTAEGRRWLKSGIDLLTSELPHQVLVDGGPAEQAFGYHRFVLDLFWLAIDFLEGNNLRRCDDFKARLLAGEGFLSSFSETGGGIPAKGDCDDGHAIAPGLYPHRLAPAEQRTPCRTFGTSGYTVLRGTGEALLTLDHGPLGMAPLYNHGHADALSITLSIAGIPFLVDAGTYRYNGVPSFRRYFKGTRAHSTVVVDGLDQAVQVTGFVWDEPFSGRLERTDLTEAGLVIEASHDGYVRLDNPVRHVRSIRSAPDGSWLITDHFQGSGLHTFELNFHFHPEVALSEQDGGWLAERSGHRLRIELQGGSFICHQGEESPPLGWYSPAYNAKVPAPVLQACRTGEAGQTQFVTLISMVQ